MRLQPVRDRRGIVAVPNDSGVAIPPLVRWAVLQSVLLGVAALVLVSPWLRVRTVVWSGSVAVAEPRYRAVETASLGRPLALVPERFLRELLGVDSAAVQVILRRHPPATLEVCLVPRHAVAQTAEGVAFDARGRRVAAGAAANALPRVEGFAHDDGESCLRAEDAALVATVLRALAPPSLRPARIERRGELLLLTLAQGGTRVRAHAERLERQLRKLVLYEHSLGTREMPADIDLRYRDQVVIRASSGGVPRVPG